jgi:hypothetical protein
VQELDAPSGKPRKELFRYPVVDHELHFAVRLLDQP